MWVHIVHDCYKCNHMHSVMWDIQNVDLSKMRHVGEHCVFIVQPFWYTCVNKPTDMPWPC